eukprot:3086161-Pyramimonas_sp.AAC.1
MMNAMTHGIGKSQLLADMAAEAAKREDQFRRHLEGGPPDNYFELIEDTLLDVGYKHISATEKRTDRREQAEARRELLRQRAELRDGWQHAGEA